MTLSIVIPTKNEETCLPDLLRSIKKQTLQPDYIVIADAGSTDRTREIARSFDAIVVKGGLPATGRNIGVTATDSDLILFLDADIVLDREDFLRSALVEFEVRELDIATSDVRPIGGNWYDRFSHRVYSWYVRLWGTLHPHAPGFFILVTRKLHEKIKGFDESIVFCEDHDYAIRANKAGRFGFLNSVIISVSVRRQNRDGRFSMAFKYILAELHILLLGPIRHNRFNYTFGHSKNYYGRK